jgi:hypothetical protein
LKTGLDLGLLEYIYHCKTNGQFAIEPTFQNFKSSKTSNVTDVSGGVQNLKSVDYSSIEIPLTLELLFFLNSKLFLSKCLHNRFIIKIYS